MKKENSTSLVLGVKLQLRKFAALLFGRRNTLKQLYLAHGKLILGVEGSGSDQT